MADIKTFYLPDLGEGLPDATIVEWLVREGRSVRLDEPLVSMETAKAVVELPSPYSGKLVKAHGGTGTVIITGAALADFEIDPSAPQRAEVETTEHHHTPASADEGSVVGAVPSSERVHAEQALSIGGVKAVPAVRALAKKLGVDLARVTPSGADGVVTLKDVKDAAAHPPAAAPATTHTAPSAPAAQTPAPAQRAAPGLPPPQSQSRIPNPGPPSAQRTTLSANGKPIRTTPPTVAVTGQPEQLKGVRREMARTMAASHAAVVPTTISDDADINAWVPGNDITVRLVRAIVQACHAVPALNAWFDAENLTRTLHPHVDIGIAVDTEDGLFVPALRNADMLDAAGVRVAINRLREGVESRSITPGELGGYTISLSNFGMFAGRYATPIVVPPCVAIVAAGKGRHQMAPVMGGFEAHRMIPLSMTFDHRAVTGGEAARFFQVMLDDFTLAR